MIKGLLRCFPNLKIYYINIFNGRKKFFLNKINVKISEGRFDEIEMFIVGLEEMLRMHRNLETEIFYPWFDDSLDDAERERVIKKLRDSRKQ